MLGNPGCNSIEGRGMVRVVGLEPTLLSEPDFESGAATNYTTPALTSRNI
jgi:hypothetical protein